MRWGRKTKVYPRKRSKDTYKEKREVERPRRIWIDHVNIDAEKNVEMQELEKVGRGHTFGSWRLKWSRPKFGCSAVPEEILRSKHNINTAIEENGITVQRFQNPERSDVDGELLTLFKQQKIENVPVGGPVLVTIFVIPSFNSKLMYFSA